MKTKLSLLALFLILLSVNINAQWFWLNPLPQGNYLNCISTSDISHIYAAGRNGTILKSTDNGASFIHIQNSLTLNFSSLVFINNETGYLGTETGEILKTTDGGLTFQIRYSGYSDEIVSLIFPDALTGAMLMRSEYKSRIFVTTNSGGNWTLSFDVPDSLTVYSISSSSPNTIYAAGETVTTGRGRLFKSTNRGLSWDLAQVPAFGGLLCVYFQNEQTGFISQRAFGRKLYRTTNGGSSWDSVGNFAAANFQFVNSNTVYANDYLNSNQIHKSTNSGLFWVTIESNLNGFSKLSFRSETEWFGIGYSNIYRTTNEGINWSNVSEGFNDYLGDVQFINQATGYIASSSGKVYKTTNSGQFWQGYSVNIPPVHGINCINFVNENTGFAGLDWIGIAKTTNGGMNWQVNAIDSLFGESITGISIPSADTGYAVGKTGSNLKTTNGGLNWKISKLPNTLYMDDICFLNNNTGYCAGRELRGVIRKTTNGGVNWSTFHLDSVFYFTDLNFVNTELGFAVGNKYYNKGTIIRTTNGGLTWDYTDIPEAKLTGCIYFINQNTGYAGAEGISYKTTNQGDNWFGIMTKSPDLNGICFTDQNTGFAVGSNGTIIKTTNGGGNPIGLNPVSHTVPSEFRLYRNFPNPFNPTTRIKFSIPAGTGGEKVEISVFDVIGRKVEVLVNEELKAGLYEVNWNASKFSSGVYFCRMKAGGFVSTNKMILLK